jgi:hypothetical protein
LHLPRRSVLADVYDAVPSLFQDGRIDYNLALAIHGSFDHRRISAAHLIREAEHWSALGTGEPQQIVTAALADFARALDRVTVPPGVPAATATQLVERRATAGRRRDRRATDWLPSPTQTAFTTGRPGSGRNRGAAWAAATWISVVTVRRWGRCPASRAA